jgi:hypothetical protein
MLAFLSRFIGCSRQNIFPEPAREAFLVASATHKTRIFFFGGDSSDGSGIYVRRGKSRISAKCGIYATELKRGAVL